MLVWLCFQGRVLDIAKDECGHVVLLAALECVDDTQLLAKAILSARTLRAVSAAHSHGLLTR